MDPLELSDIRAPFDGERLVLFPGKIVRKNGALAFCGPITQMLLTVAMGKAIWLHKINEREELCIGVKAKDIRITDDSANDDVCVSGSVEKRIVGGLNNCIGVRIGQERIFVTCGGREYFNDGGTVRLSFSRRKAFLFRCSPDRIGDEAMTLALQAI